MQNLDRRTIDRPFKFVSVLMLVLLLASAAARADVVSDWNAIAVKTAVANKQNPFAQARYAAIVQLAVFEAVNSITHEYKPYLGVIKAPEDASAEAAAVEAAYMVLTNYFGSSTDLDNARLNSLSAVPNGPDKLAGIKAGDEAATAMIALRLGDCSAPAQVTQPGPAAPGVWQLTGVCTAGIAYNWQFVAPFGIARAGDFMLPPPPALTSEAYARAYNEVMTVGASNSTERPQDRADVATYFAATSPTQAMNQAANQVAEEVGGSLTDHARALALVNMAISDSLVASFLNKYHYNFWRPVTAIHNGDADGNPSTVGDPTWAPFITTPCFPSYPSNHGSAVNAGGEVLRRLYGEGGHSITLANPATPTISLHYTTFKQIADDVSDARVYGGIHFRTDQNAGAVLGRAVGATVYKNNLRPIDE